MTHVKELEQFVAMGLDESVVCVVDYFFFFQAEDGIRDVAVTGVQTCALPISYVFLRASTEERLVVAFQCRPDEGFEHSFARNTCRGCGVYLAAVWRSERSEERRVGKECRSRWSPYH